jgi:tRNA1(Val) A37 N6-methylase TrmN6/DNA-binding CsgD family transcriptional regulator
MKRISKEDTYKIVKLYSEGMSPKDIGIIFDIYSNSVIRILSKLGIDRNQSGKISETNIRYIVKEYISGRSSTSIATNLGIANSTVIRILKKNNIDRTKVLKEDFVKTQITPKYGTTYIPEINDILLTGTNLVKLSEADKLSIADQLFNFYRKNGFPYSLLSNDEIIKDFTNLKNTNSSIIEKDHNLAISYQLGVPSFKYFSPHFYEVNSGRRNKTSMLDTFNDDTLLKKVIKNRLDGNFNMTGNMLKQGLANSKLAYKASIFNPMVAKYVYDTFTKDGDIIYDYSAGFGQRLIAAMSVKHSLTYIGVDPMEKSVKSNNDIYAFLKQNIPFLNKNAEIICSGSENYFNIKYEGKIALAFSSPPYFNVEKYENNKTQAYHNENYVGFINLYWRKTVQNTIKLLKNDGIFAINIADDASGFNIGEDMCNVLKEYDLDLIDTYKIQLAKNTVFGNKNNNIKYEPIHIFRKRTI